MESLRLLETGLQRSTRSWRVAATTAVAAAVFLCMTGPVRAARSIFDDDWTPPLPPAATKPNTALPPAPPVPGTATKPPTKPGTPVPGGTSGGSSAGPAGGSTRGPAGSSSPPRPGPAVKPIPSAAKPKPAKVEEPDPRKEFESVFGAEARKVAGTASTKDDGEFSAKLVEAARLVPESPKLQALLYEKAADFGSKDPTGYSVALEALDGLRSLRPQQSAALDVRSLTVCEKQYAATPAAERRPLSDPYRTKLMQVASEKAAQGRYDLALEMCRRAADVARSLGPDEVAEVGAVTRQISERQRVDRRVADLAARVKTAEGSATRPAATGVAAAALAKEAKELVELLAGALESPAKARAYVAAARDPALAQCLDLAMAPPAGLDEAKVLQLADWYKSLADKTDRSMPTIQATILRKAAGAYGRFLSMHSRHDGVRLKATASSQQVASVLEKSGKAAIQTTSLLSRVVPERHAVAGRWQFIQNVLVADASAIERGAALMIPVVPRGNYEISAEFVSDDASEIGFVLPVGDYSVNVLRLSTSATVSYVNRRMNTFAAVPLPLLATDHNHHVLYAKVLTEGEKAGVMVKLDGVELGRWEGLASECFPVPAFRTPDPRLPALCVWRGRAGFFGASLHMLSGSAARSDVDVRKLPTPSDLAVAMLAGARGGPAGTAARPAVPAGTVAGGRPTLVNGKPARPAVGGGGDPTALPADGSRPADAELRSTGSNGVASHDGLTLEFSELPGGRRTMAVTLADPTDEYKLVRIGFPHLMADPDNLSNLRVNAKEYQRLLALSKQTPRGYSDAEGNQLLQLYGAWMSAPEAGKAAAEHALFVAMHKIGENQRKTAAAWVDFVRQNVSDAMYQEILKYGRYLYAD